MTGVGADGDLSPDRAPLSPDPFSCPLDYTVFEAFTLVVAPPTAETLVVVPPTAQTLVVSPGQVTVVEASTLVVTPPTAQTLVVAPPTPQTLVMSPGPMDKSYSRAHARDCKGAPSHT
jgi:hypothetical protein